jgi:hypothetical protein
MARFGMDKTQAPAVEPGDAPEGLALATFAVGTLPGGAPLLCHDADLLRERRAPRRARLHHGHADALARWHRLAATRSSS